MAEEEPVDPHNKKMNNLTGLLLGIGGVDALSQGFNTYFAYSGIRAQGKFESRMALFNAAVARKQASRVLEAGARSSSSLLAQGDRIRSAQLASQSASGIRTDFGSAVDIREETSQLTSEDALEIRKDAFLQAWGYETQAIQYEATSKFAKISSRARSRAALITGGIGILSSALSTGLLYQKYRPQPPPNAGDSS